MYGECYLYWTLAISIIFFQFLTEWNQPDGNALNDIYVTRGLYLYLYWQYFGFFFIINYQ